MLKFKLGQDFNPRVIYGITFVSLCNILILAMLILIADQQGWLEPIKNAFGEVLHSIKTR